MKVAKIIDWFACKLTPRTFYYPKGSPFSRYERTKSPLGSYAAMHLISLAVEANASEIKVEVDGYSIAEKELGDWVVTVTKKEQPNEL